MKTAVSAVVVLAGVMLTPAQTVAAEKPLTGVWTLSLQQVALRLVLTQEGSRISGTLDYPNGEPFQLTGTFEDDALTFSGDSSGEGQSGDFVIHIEALGSLKSDDSLAGTIRSQTTDLDDQGKPFRTYNQNLVWTAVRATSD